MRGLKSQGGNAAVQPSAEGRKKDRGPNAIGKTDAVPRKGRDDAGLEKLWGERRNARGKELEGVGATGGASNQNLSVHKEEGDEP